MRLCAILFLLCGFTNSSFAQPAKDDIRRVIKEINQLRSQGYRCGKKWMPPVGQVRWNHELYEVSRDYARYMHRFNHFSHLTKTGEDLGNRLDDRGYAWLKIGENIAYGYKEFYGVFSAWKKSPRHCEMLMDSQVTEMGLSKVNKYWVQSFSLPANTDNTYHQKLLSVE